VNLSRLDLNLVVALRALLEERNVTGQRVGLSQPAMSAALARLRRHFDDDLLARVGGHYELTALRQLGMLGIEPRVEVSVDGFQLIPLLVAGTRRIALVQARLARLLAPVAAVRVVEPPYEAVPLREAMWWHPVHTHDAAHIWLGETAARVGRRMAEETER
jgi:hypothetical protein